MSASLHALIGEIRSQGYAFLRGSDTRQLLLSQYPGGLADWPQFVASWNDLELDTYMADGGRYRLRRHATLSAAAGARTVHREPHQAHFQSVAYNPLHGGIERWFQPVEESVVQGATMQAVFAFCCALFGELRQRCAWHIEMHQFRIEARGTQPGKPTPEGVHRDGVDYVLVLLTQRVNIASGTTTVEAASDGRGLGSFTLTDAFDAAIVDDARVLHGVTPVEAIDPMQPAYRDVLVVTFRAR
jgi:hypothetical protein